jgi:hypothetical protein
MIVIVAKFNQLAIGEFMKKIFIIVLRNYVFGKARA